MTNVSPNENTTSTSSTSNSTINRSPPVPVVPNTNTNANTNANANANTKNDIRRYAIIVGAITLSSIIYTAWFFYENRNDGYASFYTPMVIHIVVVAVTGAIACMLLCYSLRKGFGHGGGGGHGGDRDGRRGDANKCNILLASMQVILPLGCIFAGAGFLLFYIPLQSSFDIWILRWVPWAVLALLAMCPLRHRGCILFEHHAGSDMDMDMDMDMDEA